MFAPLRGMSVVGMVLLSIGTYRYYEMCFCPLSSSTESIVRRDMSLSILSSPRFSGKNTMALKVQHMVPYVHQLRHGSVVLLLYLQEIRLIIRKPRIETWHSIHIRT